MRRRYLLETSELSESARHALCRTALTELEHDAAFFEADIPWSMVDGWPPEVRTAARLLSSLRAPRRTENEQYRRTGIQPSSGGVWAAFLTFAPYAFDASVWDVNRWPLASLSDCADCVLLHLTAAQAASLAESLGDGRLVPRGRRRTGRFA